MPAGRLAVTLMGGRSGEVEILDRDDVPVGELQAALALVTEVNRRLGGLRSLRRHLAPLRGRSGVLLLDVGTGSAEVLRDLLAWGGPHEGRSWQGVGLDRSVGALCVASSLSAPHRPDVRLVRGDALRMPFHDAAFDASFTTLTLHHFSDADAATMVAEMARVSRELVVISDLERSVASWLGARLLAATRWRGDRITRHDGPLSVRRAFTPGELEAIGRRAGLRGPRVRRHFPFRLVLSGRPSR